MAEVGSFFVTIGSKLDSKGFDAARKKLNDVAKVGLAMGAALAAVGYKAAKAAGIQERAELTLAQAMKQAGTFTKEAFEHNKKYASSLQKMTEYGDEAILGVQKMLTNFGVEGEMLDKLTAATLDLAAAKKMDLTAAADLVAKSVGSTTNALTRYGIVVEGDVGSTERLQMAVDNISKIFGGAAEANAQTFLGAMSQLGNIIGDDVFEAIGFKLLPTLKEYIKEVKTNVVPRVKEWIDESGNIESIIRKVSFAVKVAAQAIYGFTKIVTLTIDAVKIAKDTFTAWGMRINQVRMYLSRNTAAAKLFGKLAEYHSKKAKDATEDLTESIIEAGITIDNMNKLELESFKLKEEEKTIVKDEVQERDIERLNAMTEAEKEADQIIKELREQSNEEEEELSEKRKNRIDLFKSAWLQALSTISTAELTTWKNLGEAYKQTLIKTTEYLMHRLTADFIYQKARAIMEATTTWGVASYQIAGVIAAFTAARAGLQGIIGSFDKGGIVPGAIGQPQLAIVHGGETIIPNHSTTTNMGNIIVNVNQVHTRHEAEAQARMIGDVIFRKVKKSRRI